MQDFAQNAERLIKLKRLRLQRAGGSLVFLRHQSSLGQRLYMKSGRQVASSG